VTVWLFHEKKNLGKIGKNAAMLSYSAYFLVFVMALENACLYFKIVLEKESLATFFKTLRKVSLIKK